ncbi:MAG: hypothetical protein MZU97_10910 [Bacillus subtilis]|nr:hypothetical protein [Bacillus subtilis]
MLDDPPLDSKSFEILITTAYLDSIIPNNFVEVGISAKNALIFLALIWTVKKMINS